MGRIVGAVGVPHSPHYATLLDREGPNHPTLQLYGRVRQAVEEMKPDLVIIFDTDHLNTFFFDNLPIFAIGVDDSFAGPNDDVAGLRRYQVPSHQAAARDLYHGLVGAGFDLTMTQEFEVDHSMIVPLHFLLPDMKVPVIPLFVNGHFAPMPTARRSFALGEAVRDIVERKFDGLDVLVIASGSFSLDVHGIYCRGKSSFVPRPDWVLEVNQLFQDGGREELLDRIGPEVYATAGNVAGEILNWCAALGTLSDHKLAWTVPEPHVGHCFSVWK